MKISQIPKIRRMQKDLLFRANPELYMKHLCHDILVFQQKNVLPTLTTKEIQKLHSYLTEYKPQKSNDPLTKFVNLRDAFFTLNCLVETQKEKELIQPIIKLLHQYNPITELITNQQNNNKENPLLKIALTTNKNGETINSKINLFNIKYYKIITETDTILTPTNQLERNEEEETET
jgi:hypothetical protein